jgi:hypothetical protein
MHLPAIQQVKLVMEPPGPGRLRHRETGNGKDQTEARLVLQIGKTAVRPLEEVLPAAVSGRPRLRCGISPCRKLLPSGEIIRIRLPAARQVKPAAEPQYPGRLHHGKTGSRKDRTREVRLLPCVPRGKTARLPQEGALPAVDTGSQRLAFRQPGRIILDRRYAILQPCKGRREPVNRTRRARIETDDKPANFAEKNIKCRGE